MPRYYYVHPATFLSFLLLLKKQLLYYEIKGPLPAELAKTLNNAVLPSCREEKEKIIFVKEDQL
jgi:hypothetical protein